MMKSKKWLVIAACFLCFGGLQLPAFAARRGGGGHGDFDHDGRGSINRGFDRDSHGEFRGGFDHGYRGGTIIEPYLGFGWGYGWDNPWFGNPYYYSGSNAFEFPHENYGTVEFRVKPRTTRVFVDGRFIGMVENLDHNKAYLSPGYHDIRLVPPYGQAINQSVYVLAGKTIKINDGF
jgi:hypothetical protein